MQKKDDQKTTLSLAQLRKANASRVTCWHPEHGIHSWSGLEWAGAMCGEAGEAANVAKKIKRVEDGLTGRATEQDAGELAQKLGFECADVLIYLDLLAHKYNIDLSAAVIAKFNQTSVAYGFPQRLAAEADTGWNEDISECPVNTEVLTVNVHGRQAVLRWVLAAVSHNGSMMNWHAGLLKDHTAIKYPPIAWRHLPLAPSSPRVPIETCDDS